MVNKSYYVCIQGFTIRQFPGCKNAAGKLRQKWKATAGTKFTKPGNGLVEIPCTYPRFSSGVE